MMMMMMMMMMMNLFQIIILSCFLSTPPRISDAPFHCHPRTKSRLEGFLLRSQFQHAFKHTEPSSKTLHLELSLKVQHGSPILDPLIFGLSPPMGCERRAARRSAYGPFISPPKTKLSPLRSSTPLHSP